VDLAPSGRLDADMLLTKHHGLGNDFLVVLDPDASHPLDADSARALCDRHTGVGADGIMRVTPAGPPAMVRMELRNADGSLAEMSGNGIRCTAQAVMLGWPGVAGDAAPELPLDIPIETAAGMRTVTVHEQVDAVTHNVSVAMGPARITDDAPEWTGGGVARALAVNTGNPHLVLDLSGAGPAAAAEVDLVALGESVNAKVTGGANVHLLTVEAGPASGHAIAIRSYERGVGLTLACGTGACASAAAARAWGLVGDVVAVDMPGGRAEVALASSEDEDVVLRGPATFVATIELGASPWR
jgi:diaminopimelate epimerase